jgi:tRNA modification GTPase
MTLDLGTIAAVATAPGEAGIAVVRISGPETREIAARVVRSGRTGGPLQLEDDNSHRLFYGRVVDPVSDQSLDEVMVAWMAAPRSFTAEDTVEISCHGGSVAVQQVLRAVLAAGARPANPGEFTMRAYLNGRIALTDAEAVLNVVSAQTAEGLTRALADLRGDLTRRLEPARAAVITALAYLDASADFPDDEIPLSDVHADLSHAIATLENVLAGARSGRLLSEGANVALVGRPNVGKSSLLNALLRSDRAIVTPIAGTTRDVVSERAVIEGIAVTLLDTAGIAESADIVEQAGVERSRRAIERAAAIVLVLDGSVPPQESDLAIARSLRERFETGALGDVPLVMAINKSDLGPPVDQSAVLALLPSGIAAIPVSAQTGSGLPELERALAAALRGDLAATVQPSLLSARQHAELDRALLHLRAASDALEAGFPTDVLATDVRVAARALGNVTGEDIDESLLLEIFSRFCIGK